MRRLSWSEELAIRLIVREAAKQGCYGLSDSDPGITDDIWSLFLVQDTLDAFYLATAAIEEAIGGKDNPDDVTDMDEAVKAGRAVVERDRERMGMA